MKNVTFSANPALIEQARRLALQRRTTLNDMFRAWLDSLVTRKSAKRDYLALMRKLDHVRVSGKFSREVMNER